MRQTFVGTFLAQLCALTTSLAGESLVVPVNQTNYMVGRCEFETVYIAGTLLLRGDTQLVVTGSPTNPAGTTVFTMTQAGRIGCDLPDTSQINFGGPPGFDGHDLSIEVFGDISLPHSVISTIYGIQYPIELAGRYGGVSGGRGGSFTLVCHGTIGGCVGVNCDGGRSRAIDLDTPGPGGDGGQISVTASRIIATSTALYLSASGAEGGYGWFAPGSLILCGAGGNGGQGGRIVVKTACEITPKSYLLACGGPGAYGFNGQSFHHGDKGGAGGNGGTIQIEAGVLNGLDASAAGNNGNLGGDGVDYLFPGFPESLFEGAPGGRGGDGGVIACRLGGLTGNVSTNVAAGAGGLAGRYKAQGERSIRAASGAPGHVTIEIVPPDDSGLTLDFVPGRIPAAQDLTVSGPLRHGVTAGELLELRLDVIARKAFTAIALELPLSTNLVFGTLAHKDPTNYIYFLPDDPAHLETKTLRWEIGSMTECELRTFYLTFLVPYDAVTGTLATNQVTATLVSGQKVKSREILSSVILRPSSATFGGQQDVPYVSDPVHAGSGNFFLSKRLFTLPANSLPITFDLAYNSGSTNEPGPLGYGWTHTYAARVSETNRHIAIVTNATPGDMQVKEVRVDWGDGRRESFFLHSTAGYTPFATRTRNTLRRTGDNYEAVRENGTRYVFDSLGRLARLVDLNGQQVSLA